MIKQINSQNFLTTPFLTAKQWELFNVENEDVITLESDGSLPIASEYIDFDYEGNPVLNISCDIALEQQTDDNVIYEEGASGTGFFDPSNSEQNLNGTYKRMVHSQIALSFYNNYKNPNKILGTEFVDFPLSNTNRILADNVRVFTVPQQFFGDKIAPKSVFLFDTSLDDNVAITDDGNQNLLAGVNIFSKIQEVRKIGNIIQNGDSEFDCPPIPDIVPISHKWSTEYNNWGQISTLWKNE